MLCYCFVVGIISARLLSTVGLVAVLLAEIAFNGLLSLLNEGAVFGFGATYAATLIGYLLAISTEAAFPEKLAP